jgi:hypothetical protein
MSVAIDAIGAPISRGLPFDLGAIVLIVVGVRLARAPAPSLRDPGREPAL